MRTFTYMKWLGVLLVAATIGCSSAQTRRVSAKEKSVLLLGAANASLVEGDPTGALQFLAQAEELDATSAEVFHLKALAYNAKKENETAIISAKKAVELKPAFSEANNTLGRLLLIEGRYNEAVTYLQKAAQDPLYRGAYKPQTNLGIIYYRTAKYEEAKQNFNKAIVNAPAVACDAYYYRGHLALKEGNFKEALRDYDHATQKFCGRFAEAHLAVGVAYERSKQYDKARKKFLDVQQNFPDSQVAEQAVEHMKYLP